MLSPTLGVASALALGLWSGAAWAAPLTADDVVRSALLRHPDVVASTMAISSAESQRREVGVFLENPQVSVGVAVAGSLIQGTVNQPISLTGEGWHARRAASAGIDAAKGQSRRSALEVAAAARGAYAWVVTTRARWILADEARNQASQLRKAVEAREAVGESRPLDARLARMAEAEATQLAISARRDEAVAIASLAVYAPEAVGAQLTTDPIAVLPPAAASSARSDVAAAEARVAEREAALAQERAAGMPRLGVGMFFQVDQAHGDPGDIGPQLALTVPIWNRNQGGVGAARAALFSAQAELEAIRARAAAEQAVLPDVSRYAEEALGRLGDFEKDAREALSSIELGWTTGEIGLSDAVLLRREILDGWVAALDARQQTVEARLAFLLATEDAHLIPADTAVEAP